MSKFFHKLRTKQSLHRYCVGCLKPKILPHTDIYTKRGRMLWCKYTKTTYRKTKMRYKEYRLFVSSDGWWDGVNTLERLGVHHTERCRFGYAKRDIHPITWGKYNEWKLFNP